MKEQTAENDDLASLRKTVETTSSRASAAEAAAAAAADEATKLKQRLGAEVVARVQSDEIAAANGLAAAEAAAAAAEAAIEAAGKAGDWSALAKAQRSLSSAQSHIEAWEKQKRSIAAWKKRQMEKPEAPAVVQEEMTSPTKAWLAAHPEWSSSEQKYARLMSAHFAAISDGFVPDTPEYFKNVEGQLGIRKTDEAASTAAEIEEAETPDVTDVATPPSRKTPTRTEAPGRIRLSAEEQEIAELSFQHLPKEERLKAYATEKARLRSEKRISS